MLIGQPNLHRSCTTCSALVLASFPDLPRLYLPFAFTIIHGAEDKQKMGKAWERSSYMYEWKSGGCWGGGGNIQICTY